MVGTIGPPCEKPAREQLVSRFPWRVNEGPKNSNLVHLVARPGWSPVVPDPEAQPWLMCFSALWLLSRLGLLVQLGCPGAGASSFALVCRRGTVVPAQGGTSEDVLQGLMSRFSVRPSSPSSLQREVLELPLRVPLKLCFLVGQMRIFLVSRFPQACRR